MKAGCREETSQSQERRAYSLQMVVLMRSPLFTTRGLQSSELEAPGTAGGKRKMGDGNEEQVGSPYYEQLNSPPHPTNQERNCHLPDS